MRVTRWLALLVAGLSVTACAPALEDVAELLR
jgi:hypothetical protein